MKKSIFALPIILFALGACNSQEEKGGGEGSPEISIKYRIAGESEQEGVAEITYYFGYLYAYPYHQDIPSILEQRYKPSVQSNEDSLPNPSEIEDPHFSLTVCYSHGHPWQADYQSETKVLTELRDYENEEKYLIDVLFPRSEETGVVCGGEDDPSRYSFRASYVDRFKVADLPYDEGYIFYQVAIVDKNDTILVKMDAQPIQAPSGVSYKREGEKVTFAL